MVLRHGICVAILCLGCSGITLVVGTRLLSFMAEAPPTAPVPRTEALQSFRLIRDVLETLPPRILDVTYRTPDYNYVLDCIGKELTPTQVKDEPAVTWMSYSEKNAFYTLCMIDPNAPGEHAWCHWLVVNIPECRLDQGDVIAEYVGAISKRNTGYHRFVFLLYKQPEKIDFKEEKRLTNRSAVGRAHFSINNFARKYNLGDPIAGITSVVGTRLLSFMAVALPTAPVPPTEALRTFGVIPDVVGTLPPRILDVTYHIPGHDYDIVDIGMTLTPTQVKDEPEVKWVIEENAFYTLCMIDPDAPSRAHPTEHQWCHWLVVNIFECRLGLGEVIAKYVGAVPQRNTGFHRYVFLLYKQPRQIDFREEERLTNRSAANRAHFSINNFARKYNLGDPIAGNMFQAEYDDDVETLYPQLHI